MSKVTPGGVVSTLVSGLNDPRAVAFDGRGNLFIVDCNGQKVWQWTPTLTATTAVTIRSSLPSRPMMIGGTNNAAVAGINLTSLETARLVTPATGTLTIGESAQTGRDQLGGHRQHGGT